MIARAEPEGSRYAGLDGLRGIAIALVMLRHFFFPPLPGILGNAVGTVTLTGWMGVDLFFVLSGFLITGICLDNRSPSQLGPFYARRALRILPPVAVLLFVMAVVSLRFTGDMPMHFAWIATFATNIRMAADGSLATISRPARHFWSLAVEEQFCLVWPAIVLLAPKRASLAAAVAAVVVAPLYRTLLVVQHRELATFVLTPARMDALAIGALIAFVVRSDAWPRVKSRLRPLANAPPTAWAFAMVGLCCMVALACRDFEPFTVTMETAGFSAIALVAGAAMTLVLAGPGSRIVVWLSRPTIAWLGRRSYALYLIHLPIYELERAGGARPSSLAAVTAFAAVGVGVSCVLAEASWRGIEAPSLALKRLFPYRPRGGAAKGYSSSRLASPADG